MPWLYSPLTIANASTLRYSSARASRTGGALPCGYSLYMRSSNGSRCSMVSTTWTVCPRRRRAASRNRTTRMPARASRTEPYRMAICRDIICSRRAGVSRSGGRGSSLCLRLPPWPSWSVLLPACFGEDRPAERPRLFQTRDDQRIDPEAAAIVVQRKAEHQQQQEEICPRPLTRRAVETEPQIGDLQCPNDATQSHEDSEDQRYGGQHFEAINHRREQVEVRQHDIVDEIRLQRNRRVLAHQPHPIGEPGRAEWLKRLVGVIGWQFPKALLPAHRSLNLAARAARVKFRSVIILMLSRQPRSAAV